MLTPLKNWYKNSATRCDPLELERENFRVPAAALVLALEKCSCFTKAIGHSHLEAILSLQSEVQTPDIKVLESLSYGKVNSPVKTIENFGLLR